MMHWSEVIKIAEVIVDNFCRHINIGPEYQAVIPPYSGKLEVLHFVKHDTLVLHAWPGSVLYCIAVCTSVIIQV